MQDLGRRTVLKMMLGIGAAAACGLSAAGTAEAKDLTAPATPANAGTAAAETLESSLEPNQYFVVRRRRPRRRYVYVRPRRRLVVVRRRRRWRW
jgi:hypothetical protein